MNVSRRFIAIAHRDGRSDAQEKGKRDTHFLSLGFRCLAEADRAAA
jgi:hypothetical protein